MTIPVETLPRYRETSWKWVKKFYQLRPNDEEVGYLLKELDSDMARVELYLLEEAMANYVKFVDLGSDIPPDLELLEVPENVSHAYDVEADRHTFNFPLWPFAPKRLRGLRPPFHKGREFIRIKDFWRAILARLIVPEHRVVGRWGPKPGKEKAMIHVSFSTKRPIDYDNYDVGPLINVLVSEGLLLSDYPSRLGVEMEYKTIDGTETENVVVSISYGDRYSKNLNKMDVMGGGCYQFTNHATDGVVN